MSGFSYIACGLIACVFIVLIKQYKPELAVVLSAVSACALLLLYLSEFSQFFSELRAITGKLGAASEYISVVLKVLGLCIITQLAADICRDAGQQSIASRVELGGKLTCLAVSLPIFKDILEHTVELIG